MKTSRSRRAWPWVAAAVFGSALAVGGGAVSRVATRADERPRPPVVLDLREGDVRHVSVEVDGRTVDLERSGGGTWSGADEGSVAMMDSVAGALFPLGAFRELEADPATPEFGLVDAPIALEVHDDQGRQRSIRVGKRNFSGGGDYVALAGRDDRVFLVPRRIADELRSVVAGRRIEAENEVPAKLRELQAEQEAKKSNQDSWWLRQATEAKGEAGQ